MALDSPQAAGIAEILKLFSGRRRNRRVPCEMALEVRGRTGRYPARLLNVSSHGALVAFDMARFLPEGCSGSLMEVACLVPQRFSHGMTIRVLHAHVRLEATVVRVSSAPGEPEVVVGCLFRRPLSHRQCRALGVVADEPDDAPCLGT